jgi:hypothetical protein
LNREEVGGHGDDHRVRANQRRPVDCSEIRANINQHEVCIELFRRLSRDAVKRACGAKRGFLSVKAIAPRLGAIGLEIRQVEVAGDQPNVRSDPLKRCAADVAEAADDGAERSHDTLVLCIVRVPELLQFRLREKHRRQIRLRVEIGDEDTLAHVGKQPCKVVKQRRFPDAPLLLKNASVVIVAGAWAGWRESDSPRIENAAPGFRSPA